MFAYELDDKMLDTFSNMYVFHGNPEECSRKSAFMCTLYSSDK